MGREVYKFLHSKDVASMMAGNVLIRPLSYYRRLEEQGSAPWIGDRLENISEVYIDHISNKTPDLVGRVAPEGMPPAISPMDATDWSATDIRVTYQFDDDPWVFCASDGDLGKLTDVMCTVSDPPPYDACIRIKDFGKFAQHLYYQGRINLRPVADIFKASKLDQVRYDRVTVSIQEGRAPVPGPFLKDNKFSSQQEGRYVLLPSGKISDDKLFINFPSSSQFLAREFWYATRRTISAQLIAKFLTFPHPDAPTYTA
jgi:hypothetical protein